MLYGILLAYSMKPRCRALGHPNPLCNPCHYVDASVKYLLVFSFQDGERKWKFDVRNDVGFNFGELTKEVSGLLHLFFLSLSNSFARRRSYGIMANKFVDVRMPLLLLGFSRGRLSND